MADDEENTCVHCGKYPEETSYWASDAMGICEVCCESWRTNYSCLAKCGTRIPDFQNTTLTDWRGAVCPKCKNNGYTFPSEKRKRHVHFAPDVLDIFRPPRKRQKRKGTTTQHQAKKEWQGKEAGVEASMQVICDEWARVVQEQEQLIEQLKEQQEEGEDLNTNFNQMIVADREKTQMIVDARKMAIKAVMMKKARIPVKYLGALSPPALEKEGLSTAQIAELGTQLAGMQSSVITITNPRTGKTESRLEPKVWEKLQEKYNNAVATHVQTAAIEREQYNASGWYPEARPWNFKEGRELTVSEIIGLISGLVDVKSVLPQRPAT
eukprot:TRINITY_DN177_c0_g1_i1.p1 TRINITY_DN177_c0_g1~~TRINITY_DN177_c0_g1_i1.p1  ORF type:complete len:324 (+),score=74.00 TRINITY_DN177_c0_g1_i1:29-1000(+)